MKIVHVNHQLKKGRPVPLQSVAGIYLAMQSFLLKRWLKRSSIQPIFIVGVPRSGTTALSRALNEHSRVLIAKSGSPLVHWLGTVGYTYACGAQSAYYQKYTAMQGESLGTSLRQLCFDSVWGNAEQLTRGLRRLQRKDLPNTPWDLRFWGTRCFPDEHSATGLSWLYPGAKFIYIFRNGIDVAFSMSKFRAFKGMSFSEICKFWASHAFRYEYLRHRKDSLAVRFEDFVENPENVFSQIFRHLELPDEPGPSRFSSQTLVHPLNDATIQGSPKEILKARKPAYIEWSTEQKELFHSNCCEGMQLLGYEIPF